MDVLSGRFLGVKKALSHQEHWRASPELTKRLFAELKEQPAAVEAAKQREKQRKQAYLHALLKTDGPCCRQDPAWLEAKFDQLMEKADSKALQMPSAEQMTWRWAFELADRDDRRYFAYKFQYAVYSDMVDQRASASGVTSGAPRLNGGAELLNVSKRIFSDAAYCIKHIKNMVANGTAEPEPIGAPPSMPRAVESVIFRLASKLRSHRLPVYKNLLIYHAQVAISGTKAALNFAKIDADGKYKLDMDGGLMWDYNKWDNWVYRRFIGDRRAVRMLGVLEPPSQLPRPPTVIALCASTCLTPHCRKARPRASRLFSMCLAPSGIRLRPWSLTSVVTCNALSCVRTCRTHFLFRFRMLAPCPTHTRKQPPPSPPRQRRQDEGIAFYNENYDEKDVDEEGVPKEPIAFWFPEERWR